MNLIKIGFTISMMGSFPLLSMQLAHKKSDRVKTHAKSKAAWQAVKDVSRASTKSLEDTAVVRMPNAREFAVVALRVSAQEVQEKAVEHLFQTPNARQAFLKDIRSESGARTVNILDQVNFLIEHSNKRRLSLVADDEEKSALEERIAKSKRLFNISPYQEEFFSMSDEQRAIMRRLYTHFDITTGKYVPASIDLSKKEWHDVGGVSRQLRGEFRTQESYLQANLMPETEDKVAYVAQSVVQDGLLGAAPGAFSGWVGQMSNELGNAVLSDQGRDTVVTSFGQAAHGAMHNAVKAAEQLSLGSLSQEDRSLHKLSKVAATFGASFPNDAKNGLIEAFTQKGPEMVSDAAIAALKNPEAILGSTSMMLCTGAGVTRGLVRGVTGMNDPIETKNIPQI